MTIRTIRNAINSRFIKRSKSIFLGSLVSQLITFASSFIITGFFTPEDFGLLGTLTALVSIIAGTLSFRFELAIINSEKDSSGKVFIQSSLTSLFCATIACLVCTFLPWDFSQKIKNNLFIFIAWTWGYIFYFNSRQLPFRYNHLQTVMHASVLKSCSTFLVQLIAGNLQPKFIWLASGRVIGDYAGAFMHLRKYLPMLNFKESVKSLFVFLRNHKDHFIFMTPHYLCVALSTHMIILFVEFRYGLAVVGFQSLAQRLIQAPLELLTSSLFNVTNQRFSELKNHFNDLRKFYLKIILLSLMLSFIFGSAIYLSIDFIIGALGREWSNTSPIAKSLIPFFMSVLITTPSSNFLKFIERSDLVLGLEVIELFIKICLLIFVDFNSVENLLLSYGMMSYVLSLVKAIYIYFWCPQFIGVLKK
jgi:O-antigen/teichoic acid export membrane protein